MQYRCGLDGWWFVIGLLTKQLLVIINPLTFTRSLVPYYFEQHRKEFSLNLLGNGITTKHKTLLVTALRKLTARTSRNVTRVKL